MSIARADVLGVKISVIDMPQAVETIAHWLVNGERAYVCVTPAHSVMDCHDDPGLLEIFNASGLTTPDGMSIVWLLRLRGFRRAARVYGPDLLLAACERSLTAGWRHFFYGGAPGVAEALVARLVARFPGLQIAGTYSPPFRALTPAEDEAVVDMINTAAPDLLWVGIGSPKQERWMSAHRERVKVPVMIGVGAAFDYLSGRKRQAPRWMQRVGLEWLFRWASEPRRLSRRYLRYPRFTVLAFAQLVRLVGTAGGRPRQG
jgi:N-acetylglucosaminyldiphosphoundecaprenol N-acetyl-beta-D-mannosaminyltransferase